jgi:2-polyprenyl-3-methyl-5-hydroxy-6-metoxy-1,4-benzoquinol methylase
MPGLERVVKIYNTKGVHEITVSEKSPEYYDEIYSLDESYSLPAAQSQYLPVWKKINEKISYDEDVFDFGCGTGQLMGYLDSMGKRVCLGIDFSYKAIEIALKKSYWLDFIKADLYHSDTYRMTIGSDDIIGNPVCAIFSEVLEHLDHDLVPLHHLYPGCHVIFTVPNYLTQSHVRAFANLKEIIDRYDGVIDIKSIDEVMMNKEEDWRIFVVDGIKK